MQSGSFRPVTSVLPVRELKSASSLGSASRRYHVRIAGGHEDSEMTTREIERALEPVTTLRGAGVQVDGRRVAHVAGGVGLVAMAVIVIVLFAVGIQKNAQITRLRQQGVVVRLTVSACLGMMGGSGSNLVGYQCRGEFTVDGHHYDEAVPGNALYPPGATLTVVTVPGDPTLVSTPHAVATEHPSWSVFTLPTVLLILFTIVVAGLVVRRRTSVEHQVSVSR